MPRQRVQTEARIPAATFDPIIAPWAPTTDTYVRPRAGTKLAQLAEGLSALAPSLARFSDVAHDNWTDEQRAAAEAESAEALRQGAKDYNDAVKKGLIRRDQNPHYRAYAEAQFGQAAAEMAAAEIGRRVNAELAESTNPEDFDKVAQEVIAGFAPGEENQNRFFQHAFNRTIQGVVANGRSQFYAAAGARYQKKSADTFHALMAGSVLQLATEGTKEEIAAVIQTRLDEAITIGAGNPTQLNEAAWKAVVSAAVKMGGEEGEKMLDALELVVTDKKSGAKLALTGDAVDAVTSARRDIRNENEAREKAEEQQRVKQIELVTQPTFSALATAANPYSVDIKPVVAQLTSLGPEGIAAAVKITEAQKWWAGMKDEDSPDEVRELLLGVWADRPTVTRRSLHELASNGTISGDTYNKLMGEIDARENRALMWQDRARADAERAKGGMVGYEDALKDALFAKERTEAEAAIMADVTDKGKAAEAVRGALAAFDLDWIKWSTGPGRNASPQDRAVWLQRRSYNLRREVFLRSGRASNPNLGRPMDESYWKTTPLLTGSEWRRLDGEFTRGTRSTWATEMLEYFGVDTPEKLRAFREAQSQFQE